MVGKTSLAEEVSCQIRIATSSGMYSKVRDSREETSSETRKKWVAGMQAVVIKRGVNEDDVQIQPLDFVLGLDGSVKTAVDEIDALGAADHDKEGFYKVNPALDHIPQEDLVLEKLADCTLGENQRLVLAGNENQHIGHMSYPSRYRIPPKSITNLDHREQVRRAELFALGSLIYEVHKGEAPFEELDDTEVQCKYATAEFPDVASLEQWPIILSCWSLEFACQLRQVLAQENSGGKFRNMLQTTNNFIKAHPYFFTGLKVTGSVVAVTSLAVPLILGAVGFGALGPIAGSSAVAWQASMGAVEAGSLFAWCQSAAMGGAAVNGIIAAGATGAGVAGAATAAGVLADIPESRIPDLIELFQNVYRRGD